MAISLVHRRGYFRQHLDAVGQQTESDVPWSPQCMLPSAGQLITVMMNNRAVQICAWRFDVVGVTGHVVPVFLLDSDVEGNDPWDRRLTDHLYGGDTFYRRSVRRLSSVWAGSICFRRSDANPPFTT